MSLALLLVLPCLAQDLPEVRISWSRGLARVEVLPPAGEHVAPEAPATGWLQVEGQPRYGVGTDGAGLNAGLWLPFPNHDAALRGALHLSLCQDGGTACRLVDAGFSALLPGRKGVARVEAFVPRPEPGPIPETVHLGLDAALAQAAAEGRLALLDFGAVWCPPCNLLSAQVLDDPADADALAPFVIGTIDADHPSSWPAKTRYAVTGYPTVVAVRPDGTEIDRLVGYPGEAATLAWLAALPQATPVSAAPDPAVASPEEALGWALRLARADQGARARPYLERAASVGGPELALARLLVAPTGAAATEVLASSLPWQDWLSPVLALAGQESALRAPLRAAITRALPAASDADAADLLDAAATLAGWEKSPEERTLYAAAAGALSRALTGDPVLDRGYWDSLADLLEQAGDPDAAAAVLGRAIAYYPHEFTWLHLQAELYLRVGRPAEALPVALGALAVSYGDNRLRATRTCARAMAGVGKKTEAIALLEEALAHATRPGPDEVVRTTRYLAALETLLAELRAP